MRRFLVPINVFLLMFVVFGANPHPVISAGGVGTGQDVITSLFGVELFKDVKSIFVAVAGPGEEAEDAGLSQNLIKNDVELKLRLAGIKVLSSIEESQAPENHPGIVLGVSVTTIKSDVTPTYAVFVDIKAGMRGAFSRLGENENAIYLIAPTIWQSGMLLLLGRSHFLSETREEVKNKTDEFINGYLSMNPK